MYVFSFYYFCWHLLDSFNWKVISLHLGKFFSNISLIMLSLFSHSCILVNQITDFLVCFPAIHFFFYLFYLLNIFLFENISLNVTWFFCVKFQFWKIYLPFVRVHPCFFFVPFLFHPLFSFLWMQRLPRSYCQIVTKAFLKVLFCTLIFCLFWSWLSCLLILTFYFSPPCLFSLNYY